VYCQVPETYSEKISKWDDDGSKYKENLIHFVKMRKNGDFGKSKVTFCDFSIKSVPT
jgi:hypothetical protein